MTGEFFLILIPIIVGLITQTTKFVIFSFKNGIKWNYLLTHGHMPSFHSALVSSLALTIGYMDNFQGSAFLISLIIGLIFIDDALRIRMYLGDQGRYLNMLVQTLKLDTKKYPRLKERVGHRTSEVIVGIIMGLGLTLILLKLYEIYFP